MGYGGVNGEIIGVVKDFHFHGLQQEIAPLILCIRPDFFYYITLTVSTENVGQTMATIQDTWKTLFPGILFNSFFLDEYFNSFYQREERTAALVRIFGMIAISIACLDILGLTAHTTQRRKKEVAVRKVVGASTIAITGLLTSQFLKWIVLANIIAWPATAYLSNRWLAGFAYRIDFSLWFLILPGALTSGLACLAVAYHIIRAARSNPVEALRYE